MSEREQRVFIEEYSKIVVLAVIAQRDFMAGRVSYEYRKLCWDNLRTATQNLRRWSRS